MMTEADTQEIPLVESDTQADLEVEVADDTELVLVRHWASKVRHSQDLNEIIRDIMFYVNTHQERQ